MSTVVLLSAYNGARFIESQVNSLLNQSNPPLEIQIRDDGSTDGTREILLRMAQQDQRIRCRFGKNLGVVASFFDLLVSCDGSFEFYSFCDQDDIWQENKISSAIEQIQQSDPEVPVLYFSNVQYVDEQLNHIGYSNMPKAMSFEHALVENFATGCTIIINRAARDLIVSRMPEVALMHDWWIFLVVSAFGKIIFDPESKILYRQHASNVVGGSSDRLKANLKKFVPFVRSSIDPLKMRTSDQVREFEKLFGDKLSHPQKQLVGEFLGAKQRLLSRARLVAGGKFRRQNKVDNFVFSSLIILGFY